VENTPKFKHFYRGWIFSIEDIEFGVKWITKGKANDIKGYQAKILKIGGSILIPHIHKLFNLEIK
jgi:hypothetical protein